MQIMTTARLRYGMWRSSGTYRAVSHWRTTSVTQRQNPQDLIAIFPTSHEQQNSRITYSAILCATRNTKGGSATSTAVPVYCTGQRPPDIATSTETRVSMLTVASTSVASMLKPSIIVLLDLLWFSVFTIYTRQKTVYSVTLNIALKKAFQVQV